MEIVELFCILALWIFVLAQITVHRKGDSPQRQTAKRLARYTLTMTLVMAALLGALALYLSKTGAYA